MFLAMPDVGILFHAQSHGSISFNASAQTDVREPSVSSDPLLHLGGAGAAAPRLACRWLGTCVEQMFIMDSTKLQQVDCTKKCDHGVH